MNDFDRIAWLAAFLTAFGVLWHTARAVWAMSPTVFAGWMQ